MNIVICTVGKAARRVTQLSAPGPDWSRTAGRWSNVQFVIGGGRLDDGDDVMMWTW